VTGVSFRAERRFLSLACRAEAGRRLVTCHMPAVPKRGEGWSLFIAMVFMDLNKTGLIWVIVLSHAETG